MTWKGGQGWSWGEVTALLTAVFQAGCGWAMAQPELLWAAAGLMLLGVAVSACVRCQLYGKALPWGLWVAVGGCFPPGVSHLRGVVLLEKRRFRGGLRAAFWYPKGCKKGGDRIFSGACCDLARGNGFRLKEGRCRLGKRKKLFQ